MVRKSPNAALVGRPGSRSQVMTPALIVDLDAYRANIAKMARFADDAGTTLRPHAKTHKCARIAADQIAAGAAGICCATLGEAEILSAACVENVLLTSPTAGAGKIARLAALGGTARGLKMVADHPDAVAQLDQAARTAGHRLSVLVDLDMGRGRTGVATPEDGVALAQRIDASEALEFGGIQAYAGHLQHVADYHERHRAVLEHTTRVSDLVARLTGQDLAPPSVTGGGTGTHEIDAAGGVFTELQPGSYIFGDVQYADIALWADDPAPFQRSLFVTATVVSTNQPDWVTVDGGLKRFATDGPLPVVARGAASDATYRFMGDEHGAITLPAGAPRPDLGALIELFTPHCDPTVNLYDHYHVVQDDRLVEIWPIDGRGAA